MRKLKTLILIFIVLMASYSFVGEAETLRQKQSRFVCMVATLIQYATECNYELTFGDAYRDPRVLYGHPKSLHKQRLAIDLNLFINGKYVTTCEGHKKLGVFWESIGGSWGGRWGDYNHYSLAYEGMR